MAPTVAEHQAALYKCHLYITSFADLPQTMKRGAMFTATPPSQLNAADAAKYEIYHARLVEGLNAPAGTLKGLSKDKVAHARSVLWKLWFKAWDLDTAAEEEEEEDEDDDQGENGEGEIDNGGDDDDQGKNGAGEVDMGGDEDGDNDEGMGEDGVMEEGEIRNDIFRLYRNGNGVNSGGNS